MYKNVSLPSVAAFQSSCIFLVITLVVGPNLLFGGLAFGLALGPLPSRNLFVWESSLADLLLQVLDNKRLTREGDR